MKTDDNTNGFGKTPADDFAHRIGHIQRYFFHPVEYFFGYVFQRLNDVIPLVPATMATIAPLLVSRKPFKVNVTEKYSNTVQM
jgi:hypothetical protein